jgi:shikimate dehydrogenase
MTRSDRGFLIGSVSNGGAPALSASMHQREARALGLPYLLRHLDLQHLCLPAAAVDDVLGAAQLAGYDGLTVAHPCSRRIVDHVDELSADAAALGAVDTVLFRDGQVIGHNVEWSGFARALDRSIPDASLERVVLLGAGRAASAVAYGLLTLGTVQLAVVDADSRRSELLVASLGDIFGPGRATARPLGGLERELAVADGLVHVGATAGNRLSELPLGATMLHPELWVADSVYRPAETALVAGARALGCRVLDGWSTAVHQQVDAFRLLTGVEPDHERMLAHLAALATGPGSGLRVA